MTAYESFTQQGHSSHARHVDAVRHQAQHRLERFRRGPWVWREETNYRVPRRNGRKQPAPVVVGQSASPTSIEWREWRARELPAAARASIEVREDEAPRPRSVSPGHRFRTRWTVGHEQFPSAFTQSTRLTNVRREPVVRQPTDCTGVAPISLAGTARRPHDSR